jgi:dihydrofolate reductase
MGRPISWQPTDALNWASPETQGIIGLPLGLIYARSENYCIGREGALPWQLPDEVKHFTDTTLGAVVIMGRKTYEDHRCALPGRLNIVITRQQDWPLAPGVHRAHSLSDALALAAHKRDRVFVIGGASCLRDALPLADTVYETVVHAQLQGDTFVDAFDFSRWSSKRIEKHRADTQHVYAFSIYRHQRSLQERRCA